MVANGNHLFAVTQHRTLMRPNAGDPDEADGVLNPGCARGSGGALYLFPREVAHGNRSRIGVCRVQFGADGEPVGVERLAPALEPFEPYEHQSPTSYGCEDARVVYVPCLQRYVMTYVALTPIGPRAALATSTNLLTWQRLGLIDFRLEGTMPLNVYCNKDALLFPDPVLGPEGRPALALLHRPSYVLAKPDAIVALPPPAGVSEERDSIWISYVDLDAVKADLRALTLVSGHQLLASPQAPWERLKIGGGAPPLLTHLGWLLIYHGVAGNSHANFELDPSRRHVRYSAGAMVLDRDDPRQIRYRSAQPILRPTLREERDGVVGSVVFPTGLDPRSPPGPGSRVDLYYGMADKAIGVGSLTLPASLPSHRHAAAAAASS
jgi:beta-1,2-mannobiose phosphorylase / 1,2-beta-oligomannan phosphorylase